MFQSNHVQKISVLYSKAGHLRRALQMHDLIFLRTVADAQLFGNCTYCGNPTESRRFFTELLVKIEVSRLFQFTQ